MSQSPHPGLPRRLAALLYDSLLILPVIMLLVAAAMAAQALWRGAGAEPISPLRVQALALFGVMAFYTGFWRLRGQTLGMQAWRIQLRTFAGAPVSARQCLLRCLAALLSLAALGLGFWWCLIDRRRRYWHDYLSGTELYLLPGGRRREAARRRQ